MQPGSMPQSPLNQDSGPCKPSHGEEEEEGKEFGNEGETHHTGVIKNGSIDGKNMQVFDRNS